MSIFQVVVVKPVTNIFIGFRMSGYYTTEPPDDSDDDLLTVLLCIGCGSVGLLTLVYLWRSQLVWSFESQSRVKVKVVKWCRKKWFDHNQMYIYHKQCEILQKN